MKPCYRNLREFVTALKQAGELQIIRRPVSPHLEISRFTDAESKSPQGGKALYFASVKGSPFPAATNLFGSPRRICMAMGVKDLDELGARIRGLLEMGPPAKLRDMLGMLPAMLSMKNVFPRRSRSRRPPCQEVVRTGDAVNLLDLPVLHCWPGDAGRFVTLPLVITRSLKTGRRNMGMYRLQIFDRDTTGMHWHIHKDGSHFFNEYREAGRRMPVAVAIGADPATIYAATAPLPRNVDELMLAGFIRNKPVPVTRCITHDLLVPSEAEFVLEGYVDPSELRREGPFGDHTGYYSLADDYPVFHVTALTHRRNPLYCATLVGRPPMEDCYLAKVTERLFLPLLQTAVPEIHDYWLPWEGVFHNVVVVAIHKEYPGHAHKVIHGLWGQGQMSFCKAIVVVDRDVDLKDPAAVMEALLANLDIGSDLILARGVLDVLDHSAPTAAFGGKIGIDATRRFPGEPPRATPAQESPIPDDRLDDALARLVRDMDRIGSARRWRPMNPRGRAGRGRNRVALVTLDRGRRISGREHALTLLERPELSGFNLVLMVDTDIDLSDDSLLLWKLSNNVDPERDILRAGHRLVVDAGRKSVADGHTREWPGELRFDEEGPEAD